MLGRLESAKLGLKMNDSEAIRLLIDFGLKDLEAINYDVYGALKKASVQAPAPTQVDAAEAERLRRSQMIDISQLPPHQRDVQNKSSTPRKTA